MARWLPQRRSRNGSLCAPRCGCERFRAPMSSENCCGACLFPALGHPDERRLGVIETREVEVRWRASQLTRAIATCAGGALAAAAVGDPWQLIALAAPRVGA